MRYLKLFESFNKQPKVLYRNTVLPWIVGLLDKGIAMPLKNKKFISFSKEETGGAGEHNMYGNIQLEFDANELYRQGAQNIEYTVDFFKKHQDICFYVTEYKNEKDYIESFKTMEGEVSWKEFVESFGNEEEVIMKKITMKPGLIKNVIIWDDEDEDEDTNQIENKKAKNILLKYKLKVEVPSES